MVYKSVTDLPTNYMKDIFTYVWDSHVRTRSSVTNDLYLPTGKHKELYIQMLPTVVVRYGTLSILIFAICKV